ncbi:hypothetical protein JCGZ_24151 [Jatropha curcas]|uniref:Uncharacterized protein n=1 Tax=Jatropha curcas TaxID=180498 RepID=A0A067JPB7_JATCU|nr:hypothetical protein JCGZ_24151 [Jatropha curcas]
MARGRGVDSDASDSGLCRGCGRGRSTRGRGGTIFPLPSPSSSGTLWASSSAQPPVSPPLPSIPSSSTPFPGPAESSPASQSPTTPASSEPRNKLSLHISILSSIKANYRDNPTISGKRWIHMGCCTTKGKRLLMGRVSGYKKEVRSSSACIRRYGRAGRRLRRILYLRESVRYLHETGAVRLAAEKYSRVPTPMEVFTYTHTKDHDRNTFVDRRALGVNMSGPHGAGTSSSDPLPAIDLHVSTTLHQPLSSPLDLDTIDDNLVTPVGTDTSSRYYGPSSIHYTGSSRGPTS